MEEQLISFNTAKLVKEKGFDNTSLPQYIQYDTDDWRLKDNQEYNELNNTIGIGNKIRISAPTQSLLQRWLREIHKIYIDVESVLVGLYDIEFICSNYQVLEYSRLRLNQCKTYEEALEKGLQEALKLIKNEKHTR
jgi:hypothetical protein